MTTTLTELAAKLEAGTLSAVEHLDACLQRIGQLEPTLRACLAVDVRGARAAAEASDMRRRQGQAKGALDGAVVMVKDNLLTAGVVTTAGSKMLEHFVPTRDATVVTRLKAAGAVVLAKTNLDEFGMGSSTEWSAFHATHNPFDLGRTPGGSSGGSAAAVAAGYCVAALGTDTGGSVRQPAAFTHLVGLKPTYGRVSRSGVVAYASSLDQVGPLGHTVADVRQMYEVIAGFDAADSTTARQAVVGAGRPLKGLRVGLPSEYFSEGVAEEVAAAVEDARRRLEARGAVAVQVSLPHTEAALHAYYVIAPCEASSNLARYDGVRFGHRTLSAQSLGQLYAKSRAEGFGPEVKRRILLGTFALSSGYYDAYYAKAQKVRALVRADFERAFETCDVLLAPTSPVLPWQLGAFRASPVETYLMDAHTVPASLAGVPAISVPVGRSSGGLPLAAQLIGRHFEESTLFGAAEAMEAGVTWPTMVASHHGLAAVGSVA